MLRCLLVKPDETLCGTINGAADAAHATAGYFRSGLHGQVRELQQWTYLAEEALRMLMCQIKAQPAVYI